MSGVVAQSSETGAHVKNARLFTCLFLVIKPIQRHKEFKIFSFYNER